MLSQLRARTDVDVITVIVAGSAGGDDVLRTSPEELDLRGDAGPGGDAVGERQSTDMSNKRQGSMQHCR